MMKAAPYIKEINGERIGHACAWCYPGASLISAFPEFTGLKVSHGMCKPHLANMMAEMDATAQIRLAPAG